MKRLQFMPVAEHLEVCCARPVVTMFALLRCG